jgi:hypothetical protein
MSGNADLLTALKMFGDSVGELRLSRTISRANEEVQKIKTSELKDEEKRAQLGNLAQQLTMTLASQGAPATTIAQLSQAMQPQIDPEVERKRLIEREDAVREDNQRHQTALTRMQIDGRENVAGMRGASKSGLVPLTQGQIDKIQEFDLEETTAVDLLSQVDADPSLVGLDESLPGKAKLKATFNPQFDAFQSQLGRWFDAYRKRITGAGAGPTELKMLRENVPSVSDRPQNFAAKINKLMEIEKKVKGKYLTNLKKAKRDVSQFMVVDGDSVPVNTQAPAMTDPADAPDWAGFITKPSQE